MSSDTSMRDLGRWLSPDPLAGDITNPQSLNRYAYVINNPTSAIDPPGLKSQAPCVAPPGYVLMSTNPCAKRPAHTCGGMVCADQYYGGEMFEGFAGPSVAGICVNSGAMGYCNQGALASFWANGSDEFDAIDPSSGVYWTAPPGSAVTDSSGRTSTSTGSLGFSDLVWSTLTNTSSVLQPFDSATQSQKDAYAAQLQALAVGGYGWVPNPGAATAQSPGESAVGWGIGPVGTASIVDVSAGQVLSVWRIYGPVPVSLPGGWFRGQ